MKRMLVPLIIILVFVLAVVGGDLYFMTTYAAGMNGYLDRIAAVEGYKDKIELTLEMEAYHHSKKFWAHRFIPTGRIDDLETSMHKLNAYLQEQEDNEIAATVAEIKSRVNRLYSTSIYHWYHPESYRIE